MPKRAAAACQGAFQGLFNGVPASLSEAHGKGFLILMLTLCSVYCRKRRKTVRRRRKRLRSGVLLQTPRGWLLQVGAHPMCSSQEGARGSPPARLLSTISRVFAPGGPEHREGTGLYYMSCESV